MRLGGGFDIGMDWQKWPKDTICEYKEMHIHTGSCINIRKGMK